MQFKKGHRKAGGRKSGTPNKATTDIKSRISTLIDEQFDAIKASLEQLGPKDQVAAYLKFLEYILPKQRENINHEDRPTHRRVYVNAEGDIVIEEVEDTEEADQLPQGTTPFR